MAFYMLLLLLLGPASGMLAAPETTQTVIHLVATKQSPSAVAPPAALNPTAAGIRAQPQPQQQQQQQQILMLAHTWLAAQKRSKAGRIHYHIHQNRRMLQPQEPVAHMNTPITDDAVSDPEQDAKMAAVVSFMEEGHKLTNKMLEENFRPANKTSSDKSGGW